MIGWPVQHLARFMRYEVIVSYGPLEGPDQIARNGYDWFGLFFTRAGAERAVDRARPMRLREKPQVALLLKYEGNKPKEILRERKLAGET